MKSSSGRAVFHKYLPERKDIMTKLKSRLGNADSIFKVTNA